MSLALIQETAREVRRLAIAGSPLAVGDFRLKKLAAPLEKAGATVAVFGQVAKGINDLVNGDEAGSSQRLLNLSTLLNAILYTQGETGVAGEYREIEVLATSGFSTRTTSRVLKPVIEALTKSGAGRWETVKSAYERGLFNDLRLIHPTLKALEDNFGELADFAAEKILPGYGAGIVPVLKATLDIKGKRADARRLMVLHRLDPEGSIDLCKRALEEGSTEVKAEALACLGQHWECIELVKEYVEAKNKVLRQAALQAIAQHDRPETTPIFEKLIETKAFEVLAGPFRSLRNKQVLNSLLKQGSSVFERLIKNKPEELPAFSQILDCLDEHKEPETEAFLQNCIKQSDKLNKVKPKTPGVAGEELTGKLTMLLCNIGSQAASEAVLQNHDSIPPVYFRFVFQSAVTVWSPEKVYEEFSPLLSANRGALKVKNESMQHILWQYTHVPSAPDETDIGAEEAATSGQARVQLDPRWLDAAIEADHQELACRMARPGNPKLVDYLLKKLNPKTEYQQGIIEALARCQYPKITDVFIDLVQSKTKKAPALTYDIMTLMDTARVLPVADLPRLDAFAAKLDEKFMDRFLEALAPLRAAAPQPEPSPEETE